MLDRDNLHDLFEKHDDEYIKFERVKKKLHKCPDIHAFLLLEQIAPIQEGYGSDIVAGANHDEIYLGTDLDLFCENATEEQLIDLIRCGIRYDNDGFCMFV